PTRRRRGTNRIPAHQARHGLRNKPAQHSYLTAFLAHRESRNRVQWILPRPHRRHGTPLPSRHHSHHLPRDDPLRSTAIQHHTPKNRGVPRGATHHEWPRSRSFMDRTTGTKPATIPSNTHSESRLDLKCHNLLRLPPAPRTVGSELRDA